MSVIDRSQTRDTPWNPSDFPIPRLCLELASRNPSWQRSCATATTDRTYDRKRSGRALLNLLQAGGRPHMDAPLSRGMTSPQAKAGNDDRRGMHYNTSREVSMAKGRKSAKGEIDAFLKRLGERVRTMRSRRGMSRKVLARHSKVSERYLAQLEAGAGHCSIVLLRRIAHAMSGAGAGV